MDIHNQNNQSFNGAFVIKSLSKRRLNKLNELVPKHKQVFVNLPKENDVLFVTRDSKDKVVADFITNNNLKFEYYPEISTKSRLDEEKPEQAAELIRNAKVKLESFGDMFVEKKRKAKKLQPVQDLEHVFQFLDISKKDVTIKSNKGIMELFDKQGKKLATVSPKGKLGITFISIEPPNLDSPPSMHAINSNGDKLVQYTSLDGMKKFRENFINAVKFSKE